MLGAVGLPGVLGFTANSSVISGISQRGGFTDDAYRARVLVIRGSLKEPERFVVDIDAVLAGREVDFRLEPKDIIYVSTKPWRYASELVDTALETFLQSMTASWTSRNIGPLIEDYVLPQLKDEPEPNP